MNLIVTGGAGFVGSHITNYLVKQGHFVTVIDNLCRGKLENLSLVNTQINFEKLDIRNYSELKPIIKNADGVFHEAALTVVQESFTNTQEYIDVNVKGTENIFKLANEFGIKVVYASSSSVYGNTTTVPVKENFDRNPINPYGETKLQDELLAEKYSQLGASIIGLRYFNIYGKGQSSSYAGVITKFLENISKSKPPIIYGDGAQIRDFVFVEDVAKANLMAMKNNIKNGFFNMGTGNAVSITELAKMVIKSSGLALEPIYEKPLEGDIMKSQADINLVKKLLKWEPEMNLQDWFNETI